MADPVIKFKISGLDELQKSLEQIPRQFAKTVIRKALKAGAEPIEDTMVLMAPKDSGFMSEHFGHRTSMKSDELAGSIFIGPEGKIDYPKTLRNGVQGPNLANARGSKYTISVASVVRFFEFGTSKLKKFPFMTMAFEMKRGAALQAIIDTLRLELITVAMKFQGKKMR